MKKPLVLWTLTILITAASAIYQRMTGPTYPISEHHTVNGKEVNFRILRSHGGETNCPVEFDTGDPTLTGSVAWKRFKTADNLTVVPLKNENGTLRAELPHQPPAGKLEYRVTIQDGQQTLLLPQNGPTVVRFKGEVPSLVIIIHVLVMFGGMLFSTRAALETLRPEPRYAMYAWWTVALLFVGGLVLGPIVQKYAFDAYWTGWPFGIDLTDNKTAAALLVWLAAAFMVPRTKNPARWIIGAAVLTLVVFLIPHSMLGSELDYSKMDALPRP
jgi:hypothetical protein